MKRTTDYQKQTQITDYQKQITDYQKQKQKQTIKKCFVFDFDCTITFTHWFHFIHNFDRYMAITNNNYLKGCYEDLKNLSDKINLGIKNTKLTSYEKQLLINNIMGGYERIHILKTFLALLINNGYSLFIASRGCLKDIVYLLEISNIDIKLFKAINAQHFCNNKNCRYNYMSKEMFLYTLYNKGYNVIRYIDDDDTEHIKFKDIVDDNKYIIIDYVYYGNDTIKLGKECQGLTINMLTIILLHNNLPYTTVV